MLIFKNNTFDCMFALAKAEYPKECCGILVGKREKCTRTVLRIFKTENSADDAHKSTHFIIESFDIMKAEISAEKEQLEIVGFYHSHPNSAAEPSKEDVMHMITGYSYPIISVKNNTDINIKCFEKTQQTDTKVEEEIFVKEK